MKYIRQSKKELKLILLSFILLGLLIVGLKVFSSYKMGTIHSISVELYDHPFTVSNAALNVQLNIYKIHRDMKDIVLSQSKEEFDRLREEINKHEKQVYENLAIIKNNILGERGLKLQQKTLELFNSCKVLREKVFELVKKNQKAEAIAILKDEGKFFRINSSANDLYDYASAKALEFKNKSITMSKDIEQNSLIMDIVILLLFLLIVYYTLKKTSNYIEKNNHLTKVLEVIRDIDKLIVREKTSDELVHKCCGILKKENIYDNILITLVDKNNAISYISKMDDSNSCAVFNEKVKDGWIPDCINKMIDSNQFDLLIDNGDSICVECPLETKCDNKITYIRALKYEQNIYGYLLMAIDKTHTYFTNENALFDDVAEDIGYALYNIEVENKLLESEERYHNLFKDSHAIELLIDPESGRIIDANKKASSFYGYSVEELKSMSINEINTLSNDEISAKMSLAKSNKNNDFIFKHKLSTGELRDVQVYSGSFRIKEDKTVLHSIIFDITDKLALKKENQEIQEQLSLIIEATNDGIWDWDLQTNQVYFSPRWKELLGYRDDELENVLENWESRIHPSDKEKTILNVNKSHKEGNNLFRDIHRLQHKDGHWVWIQARGQTVFDSDGKAVRMLGTHTDITDQKEFEEALKKEKKRYENAEKIGHVGSWEYLIETQEFSASKETKRIYGFPENSSTFSTETVESCIPERIRVHQALIDLIENGLEYNLKFKINPFDGSPSKIISSIAELEYDENHKPIKVSGFIQDITDKENTLRLLEHKKEELETVIQEAPNPMMLHNEKGKVIMINKIWEELTGYKYKEIDTMEKWIEKAYGEEKSAIREDIEHLYTLNHKVDEGTYPIFTKDGETIFWKFSSAPLGMMDGQRAVISSATDITELKKKDEMLISQSRLAAMGDMIAMIAHQWRQPITVIAMAINNLKVDMELGEKIKNEQLQEMGDDILTQTEHLSKTIDDFRNFLKPNNEKEFSTVCKVMEQATEMMSKSLQNNNITLDITTQCKSEILLLPNELLQVFINVINNAKDALIESKTEDPYIQITINEDEEFVTTKVSDNGKGIPESISKRLGEPYVSSKSSSGTGLGIYMSKIIVEKHLDGTLKWENLDKGACFTIKLPLSKKIKE